MKYLLIFIFLILINNINALIKVNTANQMLIDDSDYSTRIFHGVNVVYKIPPYHPQTDQFDPVTSLTNEDIQNLKNWGFNLVRLGVMWPGVEPVKNEYNQTYLETMATIVEALGNASIYTIIDFHQDLISRRFCGEGIPDWAVELASSQSFPEPTQLKPYPVNSTDQYPSLPQCLSKEFAQYYFSKDVGEVFQNLYSNVNGLQDRFIAYWQVLVQTFRQYDTVLGYEIINEPWGGDIYADPRYLLDLGFADRENLIPLYKAVNSAIRELDDQHAVLFEKSLVDLYDSQYPRGTPGGVEYNDRQILSYHIYCGTDRSGSPRREFICDGEEDIFYQGALKDLSRLGGGGIMTEFGAVSNETNSIEMLEFMTSEADKYLQSWVYWQFKYYQDLTTAGSTESLYLSDGQLDTVKLKALSRTYAQSIQGIPTLQTFNAISSEFQLAYTINTTIPSPTRIYFNQDLYYSSGYQYYVNDSSISVQTDTKNFLYFYSTSKTLNLSTVNILITTS
ncbi:hypothetical protein DLAC_03906 [Tieghemostelium lacteum]|uniref:Glycoside hydrolase family 5 domain-containing protein n=1 Tax=Tieghemostelium lacteum TaxID=361077 RepID=A0A152A146_TIELA|nr:hypothetical protein DLAC_03906 [Tieghemostelium lacteum]|eukprot:KYQ99939.1 hypothetical protein DLAC_03906 [Tieghemostelium lacteum]